MQRLGPAVLGALFGLWVAAAAAQERAPGYLVAARVPEPARWEALQRSLAPLLEHRRGEGLAVQVFNAAGASPQAAVRARVAATRPAYLLLVGDVDALPAFVVADAATDRPYADLDQDGFPEAAIGRIPSDDPAAVARVVARTLAYERSREAGAWRKRCALVAGEARYSPALDAVIERFFARIVSGSIAPGFDVDLTYANPRSVYCYPPERFARRVVERYNEGALVFAYVGHGNKRSVDDLHVGRRRYPVLSTRHIPGLAPGAAPPVVMVIACWTGDYADARDCIGEELLLADGGPVAFFGSSRISHPVHNAILAKELVRELFGGEQDVRLGPALDRARRALVQGHAETDPIRLEILFLARAFVGPREVAREMPRHVDMYNLLGDPALRLALPEGRVELEAPAEARPGELLRIRGRAIAAGPGQVTITLEVEREASARPTAPPGETPLERYVRANDKVTATAIAALDAEGRFEAELRVPPGLAPGPHHVKAFAQADRRCAIGAAPCQVLPTAARPAPEPAPETTGGRRYY